MSVRKRTWTKEKENEVGEVEVIEMSAWLVDYTDLKGQRRNKQFQRKRDADAFYHQASVEVRDGIHTVDSDSITVEEAAAIWLEACARGRDGNDPVEPSTLRGYQSHVVHHIHPLMGDQLLSRLTTPKVNAFRDILLDTRSRAMAKKVIVSFKAILGEAQNRGLVSQNVARSVTIKTSKRNQQRLLIPNRAEVRAILEAAEQRSRANVQQIARAWRRYHAILTTAAMTGLRASELRGLPKENVLLKERIIRVNQRADERNIIGPPKSEAGFRDIPISGVLVSLLREWLMVCPPSNFVFPNWQGNVEALANIHNRCWKPACKLAGISDENGKAPFRFHDLRHFHASRLIASGANAKEVAVEMGHSSVQMTFDRYGHLFPEDDEKRQRRSEEMAAELVG